MTYKLVPYSESIDLTEFYLEAESRGFKNNSSKKMLVDSVSTERLSRVWILYYNNEIVGTTAAHSFDEMGPNCFRIAVRSCAFTDRMPVKRLRTRTGIVEHQHVSPQFFMTAGIEWAGKDKNFYITSNKNSWGTQQRVHRTWAPILAKTGCLENCGEMFYRGTEQTIWKVNVQVFYQQLDQYGRWPIDWTL